MDEEWSDTSSQKAQDYNDNDIIYVDDDKLRELDDLVDDDEPIND